MPQSEPKFSSFSKQQLIDLRNLCFVLLSSNLSKPSPSNPPICSEKSTWTTKTTTKQQQKREWDYIPKEDWLFWGIIAELQFRGQAFPPIKNIVKFEAYNYYLSAAETIRKIFDDRVLDIRPLEQHWLGRLLTRCLIDYLAKFLDFDKIDIQTILKFIIHILTAFNVAFPGYLQSPGLVAFILRMHN